MVVKTPSGFMSFKQQSSDIHVKGDANVTVDGNSNIFTKKDSNIKTGGNFTHNVPDGDYTLNVGGKVTISAGGGGSSIKMDESSIREKSGSIHLN